MEDTFLVDASRFYLDMKKEAALPRRLQGLVSRAGSATSKQQPGWTTASSYKPDARLLRDPYVASKLQSHGKGYTTASDIAQARELGKQPGVKGLVGRSAARAAQALARTSRNRRLAKEVTLPRSGGSMPGVDKKRMAGGPGSLPGGRFEKAAFRLPHVAATTAGGALLGAGAGAGMGSASGRHFKRETRRKRTVKGAIGGSIYGGAIGLGVGLGKARVAKRRSALERAGREASDQYQKLLQESAAVDDSLGKLLKSLGSLGGRGARRGSSLRTPDPTTRARRTMAKTPGAAPDEDEPVKKVIRKLAASRGKILGTAGVLGAGTGFLAHRKAMRTGSKRDEALMRLEEIKARTKFRGGEMSKADKRQLRGAQSQIKGYELAKKHPHLAPAIAALVGGAAGAGTAQAGMSGKKILSLLSKRGR